jgi:hypothetical protein
MRNGARPFHADYGTTRYRPPQQLAELVIARDGTRTTCNRPARIGDLDHIVPFPDGPTSADNLHPPCECHHIGRHTAGWKVRRNPDGSTTWTSPQGRQYTTRPPERWTTPNAT